MKLTPIDPGARGVALAVKNATLTVEYADGDIQVLEVNQVRSLSVSVTGGGVTGWVTVLTFRHQPGVKEKFFMDVTDDVLAPDTETPAALAPLRPVMHSVLGFIEIEPEGKEG